MTTRNGSPDASDTQPGRELQAGEVGFGDLGPPLGADVPVNVEHRQQVRVGRIEARPAGTCHCFQLSPAVVHPCFPSRLRQSLHAAARSAPHACTLVGISR